MTTLFTLLLLLLSPGGASPGERFPHERHARLFPLCEGCHAGVSQAGSPLYPDVAECARCHDGRRRPLVAWDAPARAPSNLHFSHASHAAATARSGAPACSACHTGVGERPRPEACFACHGRGDTHLEAGDRCRQCHVAVADVAAWDASRIAALPRPAQHDAPDFAQAHARAALAPASSCSTCHARESCERCHVNAARVPAIQALDRDARVAAAVRGKGAAYARPASHDADWGWAHGARAAADAAGCANCHARSSCTACHARGNAAIGALPDGARARGVEYARAPRAHAAGFDRKHDAAGGSEAACLGCHGKETCEDCHAARRAAGFHPANFAARHGPEAYGSQVQCSSCHNTEVFCRSCHAETGRASSGRGTVSFHNASPLWLMGHGQSARQSLESCASCHAQADCARCHSTLGGWGVNPHGAGFNASRMQSMNRLTCLRCHRSAAGGG